MLLVELGGECLTDLATADTGSSVSSSKRQAAFTRKSVIYCAGEIPLVFHESSI